MSSTLKPQLSYEIATYTLPSTLHERNLDGLLTRLDHHMMILRSMQVRGVALSFREVPELNEKGIKAIVEHLSTFHTKVRAYVSLIEYSSAQYMQFIPHIENSPVALFKTIDIMALAIGTSKVRPYSPVLLYMKNPKERQSFASYLINKNFFVIQVTGAGAFKKRLEKRDYFDAIVTESYMSNVHDEVNITYKEGIYYYTFKGSLTETVKQYIDLTHYAHRLKMGHKFFVFDVGRVFHLSIHVAQLIATLDEYATKAKAHIGLINLDKNRIDSNALTRLNNSHIWLYEDLAHVLEDPDVEELRNSYRPRTTEGLSKELLGLMGSLEKTLLATLGAYGIQNSQKMGAKTYGLDELERLKPLIITHISFEADYEGHLYFLFAQKSVEMILHHVLGGIDNFEGEDFLDAMNEFVNTVAGKLKTTLSDQQMCIEFSLPNSYALLTDTIDPSRTQKAVVTTFEAKESTFYCAMTHPF
ncbi:MAG: hypothetical protein KU37_08160 [Sulfuricurvum sp. PC08-66]|nr:MAG: hypothetical protein KU37_08160 [Sulfuricurvum sp. PC08-66]